MRRSEAVLHRALKAEAPLPERIVLAVSGGPDSLILLEAAAGLKQLGCLSSELEVATFDHGWRSESASEVDFVAGRSRALGLRHHRGRALVSALKAGEERGPEDGARQARYQWLGGLARELGAAWVLTAHSADDQLETRLWRLLSGAAMRLSSGIPQRRDLDSGSPRVELLRPFLDLSRAEIEAELRERGLSAIRDPSNKDPRFLRPRLRALLPELFKINPALRQVFSELAEDLRDLRALLPQALEGLPLDGTLESPTGLAGLRAASPTLRREWLRQALEKSGLRRVPERHLRKISDLIDAPNDGVFNLSEGAKIVRRDGRLRLVLARSHDPRPLAAPLPVSNGAEELRFAGRRFAMRMRAWTADDGFDRSLNSVVFDADSLGGDWSLRHPRPGDAMAILGMPRGRRELRKIFRAAGLPPDLRRNQVLLCLNDEPVWIPGLARAAIAPVHQAIQTVLEWRVLDDPEGESKEAQPGPRPLR